jgi:hypothetical protein
LDGQPDEKSKLRLSVKYADGVTIDYWITYGLNRLSPYYSGELHGKLRSIDDVDKVRPLSYSGVKRLLVEVKPSSEPNAKRAYQPISSAIYACNYGLVEIPAS